MKQEIKESKKLRSIKELAEFLKCSTGTAQRYKNSGMIPFRQIGKTVIFDTEDIMKAIEYKPETI